MFYNNFISGSKANYVAPNSPESGSPNPTRNPAVASFPTGANVLNISYPLAAYEQPYAPLGVTGVPLPAGVVPGYFGAGTPT